MPSLGNRRLYFHVARLAKPSITSLLDTPSDTTLDMSRLDGSSDSPDRWGGASMYNDTPTTRTPSECDPPSGLLDATGTTRHGELRTPRDRRMPSMASLHLPAHHASEHPREDPVASVSTGLARRPRLGPRSFSNGTQTHSTNSSVARGRRPLRLSTAPPVHVQGPGRGASSSSHAQEWSLFGQIMMENEGPLRSLEGGPPGPGPGPGPGHGRGASTSPGVESASRRLHVSESVVQSPVEEVSSDGFSARVSTLGARSTLGTHSEDPGTAASAVEGVAEAEDGSSHGSTEARHGTGTTTARGMGRWIPSRLPTIPRLWKNMLKCSVAYFIGSLFTFHPGLSRLCGDLTSYGSGGGGPYPSAHLIATMCVCPRSRVWGSLC